jgi:hypothetical protein
MLHKEKMEHCMQSPMEASCIALQKNKDPIVKLLTLQAAAWSFFLVNTMEEPQTNIR